MTMFSNESDSKSHSKMIVPFFKKKEISLKERVQYKLSYGLASFDLFNLLFMGLHILSFLELRERKKMRKCTGRKWHNTW